MKFKGPHSHTQNNLEKEEQSLRIHSSCFQKKIIVIKIVLYWQKDRYVNQWSRTKSLELSPHIYGQLIYCKDAKAIQWRKDNLFNKWCWENWTCKRMKLDPCLMPCTVWIKDLNLKAESVKLLDNPNAHS
jgi:hypothetical protein